MIFKEGDGKEGEVMHSRKNEKVYNIDSILTLLVLSLQKTSLLLTRPPFEILKCWSF